MLKNNRRQEERTGKYGTPRLQYLQELVSKFQNATDEVFCCGSNPAVNANFAQYWFEPENVSAAYVFENFRNKTKERILANLANFAYDPYNFTFLSQLNILKLFLDCITEPNEKLVEFGVGGICNSSVDNMYPVNAAVITESGGMALVIQCLSSPVRNINFCSFDSLIMVAVNYALGSLYYLCNSSTKEEILKAEVVDVVKRYAAAESMTVSFCNLAKAFLDKHVHEDK